MERALTAGLEYTCGTSLLLRIVEVEVLTDFVDHGRDNLLLDCLCDDESRLFGVLFSALTSKQFRRE